MCERACVRACVRRACVRALARAHSFNPGHTEKKMLSQMACLLWQSDPRARIRDLRPMHGVPASARCGHTSIIGTMPLVPAPHAALHRLLDPHAKPRGARVRAVRVRVHECAIVRLHVPADRANRAGLCCLCPAAQVPCPTHARMRARACKIACMRACKNTAARACSHAWAIAHRTDIVMAYVVMAHIVMADTRGLSRNRTRHGLRSSSVGP